jgi:hypothetical protein
LSGATQVEVNDHWFGFSWPPEVDAEYRLTRTADGDLRGTGVLGNGYYGPTGWDSYRTGMRHERTRPFPVSVPDTAVQAFLALLETAPLATGGYVPHMEYTDSYPELTLRIRTIDGRIIEFFSSSQGRSRSPWKVTVAGLSYVCDSDIPQRAVAHLVPFLTRPEHPVYR